jgi:hypothetical protein
MPYLAVAVMTVICNDLPHIPDLRLYASTEIRLSSCLLFRLSG